MNINLDMAFEIQLILRVYAMRKLKVPNTCSCVYFSQRLELFDNLNEINPSFIKLSARGQVNILLYDHSSNNSIF